MRLGLCLLLLWSVVEFKEVNAAPRVTCKDESNNDADWYILYKAPDGQRYIYISINGEERTNKNIGNPQGVLAHTLWPLFDNNMPNSFGFLSYNDQPPYAATEISATEASKTKSPFGHSKGVVLGDSLTQTALWLTHSTPKFPMNRNLNTFWPDSGNKNGQTFMCVTLKFSDLQVVGTHLQYIHAYTFDRNIPASFPTGIRDAADNKGQAPQNTYVQELKVGNKQLKVVAKKIEQTAADGDLYVQLTRIFNSKMDAKVWGCQSKRDGSYCEPNQHKVMNVIEVKTNLGSWRWSQDHSKWAITTDDRLDWTCIGDMNRSPTQYVRPGGALCMEDKVVSDLFRGFVKEQEECGQNPKKRPRDCDQEIDVELLSDGLQELYLDKEREEL